jgi:hypothetical protein
MLGVLAAGENHFLQTGFVKNDINVIDLRTFQTGVFDKHTIELFVLKI